MRDAVAGFAFAALGALVVWLSRGFPDAAPANDAGLLPTSVGALLVVSGGGIAVNGLARLRCTARGTRGTDMPNSPVPDQTGSPERAVAEAPADGPRAGRAVTLAVFAVGVALYAWLAINLGYLTTTFVFLLVAALALGSRWSGRWAARLSLVSIAFTAGLYVVFTELLGVRLPGTFLP